MSEPWADAQRRAPERVQVPVVELSSAKGTLRPVIEHTATRRFGGAVETTGRRRADQFPTHCDGFTDRVVAKVAHELRQPLGTIVMALALMGRHISDEDDERARQVIDRQVKHLTRLLDDLLDVGRIRTGKMRLRKERVQVRRLIDEAAEGVQPLIEERTHQFVVSQPPPDVWITADSDRLHQALLNLLQNAAKYTAPGGTVWLGATAALGRITISVRDTRKGIAPDMLEEVFTLFTQGPDSDPNGLGIGLMIVREIVELHGGTIESRSGGPNLGSEFIVTLPVDASTTP
jgi:signal transduction histidine kinase